MRFGQFAEALKLSEPIAAALFTGDETGVDFLALMSEGGPQLVKLMALLTGESEEWIAGLELEDALALAEALWEVNQDFFRQRLPKMLERFGIDMEIDAGAVRTTGASEPSPTSAKTPGTAPTARGGAHS